MSPQEAESEAMELSSQDASTAGRKKRGRSVDDADTPGKRVRFASPGNEMELCEGDRIRLVSPPANVPLYTDDDQELLLEDGKEAR